MVTGAPLISLGACRKLQRKKEQAAATFAHELIPELCGRGSVCMKRETGAPMFKPMKLALVLALLCVSESSSLAQSGTPQEQQACSRDASRLCRKQLGDDGAVQQCLQQNRTKLSAPCQKVFQSHGM
jgi:hypothetical protein